MNVAAHLGKRVYEIVGMKVAGEVEKKHSIDLGETECCPLAVGRSEDSTAKKRLV